MRTRGRIVYGIGACLMMGVLSAGLYAEEPNRPANASEVEVTIDPAKTFEPISPFVYGQFIEHLGRCIYGGIWAEMLEDRKFYFPIPASGEIWRVTREKARVLAASPWKVIGPEGTILMVKEKAYSGGHAPQITLPGAQETGICQGELGLVKGREYCGRIFLCGDASAAPVKVSLVWGDKPRDRQTVTIEKLSGQYTPAPFHFEAGADTENGRLEITSAGKGKFCVGVVSLMPADNVEGFRKDTLDLLRQLNAPIYRWPGGNFVSGYDWRDGLGERDRRPTRTNPAWTGIETNDMGMHEFVVLCRLIGAEPMIAVNTGFGDAYSAAAEVEYANGSTKTPMGQWRAKNGRPEPFKVKHWCVGNEMFGDWQLGYMQLDHYVLKHNWVEEKMRQIDPSIVTIGSGNVGPWSEGMLRSCADHMNLISEHFYCGANADPVAHAAQIPNNIRRIADAHRKYRDTIPSLKGKDIRISLDEWNFWYGPHLYGELGTRYFMNDALGIARGLHEYFRNSDLYYMANYAQTVNVIGCIKTTKTAAGLETTALPLMLYRRQFGSIPVGVEGSTDRLDVAAAWTQDRKALTVAIVNPAAEACRLTLKFRDRAAAGPAQGWEIAGDSAAAYNEPGKPMAVSIVETAAVDLASPLAIKPFSVLLLRAKVK